MAGVFLSYDRDDTAVARSIARALEKAGHSVWWDLHVRGGAQFAKVIEEALKAADVVVVLWSKNSVESAWVRDEAAAGRDSGRLVPVTIDGTEAPLGFRQFQTIDLSHWKGRRKTPALSAFLADVAAFSSGPRPEAIPDANIQPLPAERRRPWKGLLPLSTLVLVVAVGTLLFWRPWVTHSPPTLVVRPSSQDSATVTLAHDLAARLAGLQAIRSDPIRVVTITEAATHRPALALELGQVGAAGTAVSAVLTSQRDGTILWSGDFKSTNLSDLKQQVSLAAAHVTGCAGEGMANHQLLTDEDTLRLYLNACAQSTDYTAEPQPLVGAFRAVVAKAPRFFPAWQKLLVAEADQIDHERDNNELQEGDIALLRQHIAQARLLDSAIAEATLAQVALLPLDDLMGRLKLLDAAKSAAPDNPAILSARSAALRSVGRMTDSIADAQRAVQLDPLSPARNADYFAALAFAGQTEAARDEVEQIERLWPGSTAASDLEFVYNLHFGNPRKALPIAEQRALKGLAFYLKARIDPSQVGPYILWLVKRKDFAWGRLGVLAQSLSEFHREELLYETLSSWPDRRDFAKLGDVWFRPALHRFRQDPRFIKLMAETPILKYWQSTGKWADFCFAPDLPYDCKKEAAKFIP